MADGLLVAVPELASEGPAHLLNRQGSTCTIRFLGSGAEMTQEAHKVVRYPLLPGTRLRWRGAQGERSGQIADFPPRPAGARLEYAVHADDGAKVVVNEATLLAVEDAGDPFARLSTAQFHDLLPRSGRQAPLPLGPSLFTAREALLAWRGAAWAAAGGVVSLAGARIEPLPHQIRAARSALARPQVRVLLADEVGLGKTIEAGLILQTLAAAQPNLRAVIVVPGALLSQWLLELHVRFGGRTPLMLDHDRLRQFKGDPWAQDLVLISAQALEQLDRKQALRFTTTNWDVAVVDECHRMQPGGRLFGQVQVLSKRARHVLLLSATPDRRHAAAYAGLLSLLRPGSAPQAEEVQRLLAAQDDLENLCQRTLAGEPWKQLEKPWRTVVGDDQELHAQLKNPDPEQRVRLVEQALERLRLDADVIRNRRADLAQLAALSGVRGLNLARRVVRQVHYTPDETEGHIHLILGDYAREVLSGLGDSASARVRHWLALLLQASWTHPDVLADLITWRQGRVARMAEGDRTALGVLLRGDGSPGEQQESAKQSALAQYDPRRELTLIEECVDAANAWQEAGIPARSRALVTALKQFWEEFPGEKVLVFVQSTDAVPGVAADLADQLEQEVLSFSASQAEDEREAMVRRFQGDDRLSVLVSDALGGEGRNFQFVSLIAHYDLPWSPSVVEQRVGRVDRLGRDGEVQNLVITAKGGVDAAWAAVLDHAVGIFTRSSAGLEFVLDDVAERALLAALEGGAEGLQAALPACRDLIEAERAHDAQRGERHVAHELASFAEAGALAQAASAITCPTQALSEWVRGMGGRLNKDHQDERLWHLRLPRDPLPVTGVFDRTLALSRHHLAFFAPGQHQIDAVLADAQTATWCSAGAWRRSPAKGMGTWEGLRMALALTPDWNALTEAGVARDAWRLVADVWDEQRHVLWLRWPEQQVEHDAAMLAHLAQPFGSQAGDQALSVDQSRGFWLGAFKTPERFTQLKQWQGRVQAAREACTQWAATASAQVLTPLRPRVAARLQRAAQLALRRAQSASARLGENHADSQRLSAEAERLATATTALDRAISGARLVPESVAYVVIA